MGQCHERWNEEPEPVPKMTTEERIRAGFRVQGKTEEEIDEIMGEFKDFNEQRADQRESKQ